MLAEVCAKALELAFESRGWSLVRVRRYILAGDIELAATSAGWSLSATLIPKQSTSGSGHRLERW